jgi:hypothetical protein
MSRTVWISCKKEIEYRQQVTVTDEEYKILKDLDHADVGAWDTDTQEAYEVIEGYINENDVFDAPQEYMSVTVSDK